MTAAAWQLAQLNVAYAVAPLDSATMAEFMGALDRINALAEASPGFVWRLQSASGNATDIRPDDDPELMINMSVWEDAASLHAFAYKSDHAHYFARRQEWFRRPDGTYQVLWWVPARAWPTLADGMARLARLERDGPTPDAFTFKQRFPAPLAAA